MPNHKLGLLLLPLIPLGAIGIVEVANRILSPDPTAVVNQYTTPAHVDRTTAPTISVQPVQPPVMPKG